MGFTPGISDYPVWMPVGTKQIMMRPFLLF